MKKSIPFNMRADKEVMRKLDEICQHANSNRSEMVRLLIEVTYKKHKRRLDDENSDDSP